MRVRGLVCVVYYVHSMYVVSLQGKGREGGRNSSQPSLSLVLVATGMSTHGLTGGQWESRVRQTGK